MFKPTHIGDTGIPGCHLLEYEMHSGRVRARYTDGTIGHIFGGYTVSQLIENGWNLTKLGPKQMENK